MKTPPLCRRFPWSPWLGLLALLAAGALAARAEEIIVTRGSTARVAIPEGIRKIALANPTVADAKPSEDGRTALVAGLAEGESDLRIERLTGADWVGRVVVRADLQKLFEEIKELLSDVEGIEIKAVGNKIVIKGNMVTKSSYDKVRQVADAYAGAILNMATFDRKEINQYVEQTIRREIGQDSVTVRVVEDTAILEGIVYSEADAKRAEELARLRMPNVRNMLRVQDVMIETDVQFVQVNTDSGTAFGNNVMNSLGMEGGSGLTGGNRGLPQLTYGVNASAAAKVKALIGSGSGSILAQPHLSTKNGAEGYFQSGGVTYFSVAGNVGGSLKSVEYGIILKVKPTLQGRDRILNEVSIEVSVPNTKSQGAFSLDKFKTENTILCKVGESIILSGLIQELATRYKEKTPMLGDIPLLNLFFSEKTTKNDKKELLVLLTPTPVFPMAAPGRPLSETQKHLLDRPPEPKQETKDKE